MGGLYLRKPTSLYTLSSILVVSLCRADFTLDSFLEQLVILIIISRESRLKSNRFQLRIFNDITYFILFIIAILFNYDNKYFHLLTIFVQLYHLIRLSFHIG